jgi:hypothetical protein
VTDLSSKDRIYYMIMGMPNTGKNRMAKNLADQMTYDGAPFYMVKEESPNAAYDLAVKSNLNIIHHSTNLTAKSRAKFMDKLPDNYVVVGVFMSHPRNTENKKKWLTETIKKIGVEKLDKISSTLEPFTTKETKLSAVFVYDCATGEPIIT